MPIVYKYRLGEPVKNADIIEAQLRLANDYWNERVELEREKRAELREISPDDSAYQAARQEHEDACREVKLWRKEHRSRKVPEELRQKQKEAGEKKKKLHEELKELRKGYRPEDQKAINKAYEEKGRLLRLTYGARYGHGLQGGTYQRVEQWSKVAFSTPIWWDGEENDPPFRRYRGGTVAEQLPWPTGEAPHLTTKQLMAGTRWEARIALDEGAERTFVSARGRALKRPQKGSARSQKYQRGTLYMRVRPRHRDPQNRDTVIPQAEGAWPILMHRPLPDDHRINFIDVRCEIVERPWKKRPKPNGHMPEYKDWESIRKEKRVWYVYITVSPMTVEASEVAASPTKGHRVSVDFGWRKFGDGIRVATWKGSDGRSGEVLLKGWEKGTTLGNARRADEIRSIRDINLLGKSEERPWWNGLTKEQIFSDTCFKDQLIAFLEKQEELPLWIRKLTKRKEDSEAPTRKQALAYLRQWRSSATFRRMIEIWHDNRFEGDEAIFLVAALWRRQDRHLMTWEKGQRDKFLGQRREIYRLFANQLAKEYEILIVDNVQINKVARKKGGNRAQAHQRVLASPSSLRTYLYNVFLRPGRRVVEVWTTPRNERRRELPERLFKIMPAVPSKTRHCSECGSFQDWDVAVKVWNRCSVCQTGKDQDINACDNLLHAFERSHVAKTLRTARKDDLKRKKLPERKTRFQRSKERKAKRDAQKEPLAGAPPDD